MELDPQEQEARQQQLLRRFKWFVVGLTVFCLLMIFWLPR